MGVIKFVLTEVQNKPHNQCGQRAIITADGFPLIDIETWAMYSCGAGALSHFRGYEYPFFKEKDNIEQLRKFLISDPVKAAGAGYTAKEFLMILSGTQIPMLPVLLAHPSVKKLDHWENRAHSSNGINLYRLSC